ncbi:unnamed protein product, partial [Ectocarpus sp. 12 AP-2014]
MEYLKYAYLRSIIITIKKSKNMSVKAKYQGVLDLGEQLGIKDGNVTVEGDVLKIKGQAKTP